MLAPEPVAGRGLRVCVPTPLVGRRAAGKTITPRPVLAPRHGVVEGIIVAGIGATTLLRGWGPRVEPQVTSSSSGPDTLGNRTNAPSPMSPALRRAAILWRVVSAVVLELRERRAPDYLAPSTRSSTG